jgi:hypothetical protein
MAEPDSAGTDDFHLASFKENPEIITLTTTEFIVTVPFNPVS